MKKLAGILSILSLVACGSVPAQPDTSDASESPAAGDAAVATVDKDAGPVDSGTDCGTPPGNDAGVPVEASTPEQDAGTPDADVPETYVPDASDGYPPPSPDCECRAHLYECSQAFPDLYIDCGAEASCTSYPYYTVAPGASWVQHRLVGSGNDDRSGCFVAGNALCCSH